MPSDLKSIRGSGGSVGSWQQQAAYPMTFRMDENAITLGQYHFSCHPAWYQGIVVQAANPGNLGVPAFRPVDRAALPPGESIRRIIMPAADHSRRSLTTVALVILALTLAACTPEGQAQELDPAASQAVEDLDPTGSNPQRNQHANKHSNSRKHPDHHPHSNSRSNTYPRANCDSRSFRMGGLG